MEVGPWKEIHIDFGGLIPLIQNASIVRIEFYKIPVKNFDLKEPLGCTPSDPY